MKSLEFRDLGAESRWEPLSSCWDPDWDPALCSLRRVEWKTHLHAHPMNSEEEEEGRQLVFATKQSTFASLGLNFSVFDISLVGFRLC